MNRFFLFASIAFVLLALGLNVKAEIVVENIDTNVVVEYTQNSIGIDVNLSSDSNLSIIVQLYDNNTYRTEEARTLESLDGNTQYYDFHFPLTFSEGVHILDVNIVDSNYTEIAWGTTTITVLANPLIFDDPNLSIALVQQYILPIARSLSECIVQKTDLNATLTQAHAVMKSLENDVGIAEADKIEAENKLVEKRTELDSCNSAWATCKADKSTFESDLLNSEKRCTDEKLTLKGEEENERNYIVGLKQETIEQRDTRILELAQSKLEMEAIAVMFGILFFGMASVLSFLYYKNRIR